MRVQIVVGNTYGPLVVEGLAAKRHQEKYYVCRCRCGAKCELRKSSILADRIGCKSCQKKANRAAPSGVRRLKHGMTHSFEFSVWTAMRKRCQYEKHPHYALYGGRGISVCTAWETFSQFYRDMGASPFGNAGSIDRINPNGGYEPNNCRWILRAHQSKNRRNVPVFGGKTIPDLAVELGVKYTTLRSRINAGWPRTLWGYTPQQLGTRKE